MTAPFRIVDAGDAVLIVAFEPVWDEAVNAHAVAAAAALRQASLPGVRDIVPTYRSVGIHVEPLPTLQPLRDAISRIVAAATAMTTESRPPIEIPVCYGGVFGPDLLDVAALAREDEAAVIERHVARTYRVGMLGFMPGFAYMTEVDARIAMPRRAVPRTRVPVGSVGVAGAQTGIYPFESPGGWQLVGRNPVRICDFSKPDPLLLSPGRLVRFHPHDEDYFVQLAEETG